MRMQRARDDFLASPALASDEHGGLGARHPLDQELQPAERATLTDQLRKRRGRYGPGLQARELSTQLDELDRLAHAVDDRRGLVPVGDEVEGLGSDRANGVLERRARAEDHYLCQIGR